MAALDTGWDPETLESMKVADLRALCKRRTIPGTSRLRKQELIDRILAGKSSSNSKDPSEGRTGATAAERKGVSSRFQGKMTTKCMEMVRDGSLSKYRSQCAAKSGCDHYRTRSQTQLQATTTAPAAPDELEAASSLSSSSSWSDSASLASLQIDHTFECQAVAHALVSTESMHKILKHVDLYASRKYQPKAVQRVVAVVFPVQNERKDFFNIKLLPQALQQEGKSHFISSVFILYFSCSAPAASFAPILFNVAYHDRKGRQQRPF